MISKFLVSFLFFGCYMKAYNRCSCLEVISDYCKEVTVWLELAPLMKSSKDKAITLKYFYSLLFIYFHAGCS